MIVAADALDAELSAHVCDAEFEIAAEGVGIPGEGEEVGAGFADQQAEFVDRVATAEQEPAAQRGEVAGERFEGSTEECLSFRSRPGVGAFQALRT